MTAIKVPPLGESIVEATVSRWLKQEGEAVAAGDTLVELETIEPAVGRDGESSHASGRGLYWSAECYAGVVRRVSRARHLTDSLRDAYP